MIEIKNDNTEGEEFLNQSRIYARPKSDDCPFNDYESMFADDTAVVVISGNKEN